VGATVSAAPHREQLAREMIFCARRFNAQEAVTVGLIKMRAAEGSRQKTLKWCETIKAAHSPCA
jgi:1,4-dihydroxy-2-naphthoyl-CoA synthase